MTQSADCSGLDRRRFIGLGHVMETRYAIEGDVPLAGQLARGHDVHIDGLQFVVHEEDYVREGSQLVHSNISTL